MEKEIIVHQIRDNSHRKKALTLAKVIFWDLGLACADLFTDLFQALAFLSDRESRNYGFVSLFLVYFPASFFLLLEVGSTKNCANWKIILKTIFGFLLHPFLLPLAYFKLIWQLYNNQECEEDEQKNVKVLIFLKGGLVSTSQLVFQSWLILIGFSKQTSDRFRWIDWEENSLIIPNLFLASVIASFVSVAKTVFDLNSNITDK